MNETLPATTRKQLNRISHSIKNQLWEKAMRLNDCKIRFSTFLRTWIALGKDPCPECKNEKCPNYNKEFMDKKRLMILGEVELDL